MSITIRKILNSVSDGTIRIPAFQRGFVWDAERVAFLMDSIYKDYPFGALTLWRTKEKLVHEKQLGPFQLPEVQPDYPIDYVLDGQQRLTSIFGVFQTELKPSENAHWMSIYFDLLAEPNLQDSQFVCLQKDEVDETRHFPIGTFFDVVAYRKATEGLSAETAEIVDQVQSVFKEATIPTQQVTTEDRAKVAIVFERVNRLGVELDTFQLLSAWTWSENFDLQERIRLLSAELAPFGFGDIGEDTNLILRCCAAVVSGDASPATLMELNGEVVRDRFDEIENGIKGAIDFVKRNFEVQKLANLPYPALLVPLAVFFAIKGKKTRLVSNNQREVLTRWFWKSCFSRRFSAGVLINLKKDINEILKLRAGEPSALDSFHASVDESYFIDQTFIIGNVHTKTFILLLASNRPLSFISGISIDLAPVLQAYNRNEFHHLMPQKFLRGIGKELSEMNALANFAVISAVDNNKLSGEAPSLYRRHMSPTKCNEILASAFCPDTLFNDDYQIFILERARLLARYANGKIDGTL